MPKSLRTFIYAGLGLGATLALLIFFVLGPRLRAARDGQIRQDAQKTIELIGAAENEFASQHGTFTANLTDLKPWLKNLPPSPHLHFGFNPECLRSNGVAHSIGQKADEKLAQKLQVMFSELPCADRNNFTAMVVVRTSEKLEFLFSGKNGFAASMSLTDNSRDAGTEIASFKSLLLNWKSATL